MPTLTQQLRSERHHEVGHVLRRDAGVIIEKWARRSIEEQPQARRVHHQTLLNDLPKFLPALADGLGESTDPDGCPQCATAARHGCQRWQAGWSLPEVVHDYQLLRLVILGHLEEAMGRPVRGREVQAIDLALDDATAAAVAAYAQFREEEVRRTEQEQRKLVEALRTADARKNEFLAVLAHELRNPLAPILHSVAALHLLGVTDPRVLAARDIVERQVKQMTRLVDDLLDVTRIAQGKFILQRERFELSAAVAQAVQTTAPLYQAQRHHLTVDLPAEPLTLEADQARVVQILVNLLNNAAKYTDPGGRIVLTGAREGGEVVLRVRDNGTGIGADMLGRIFDLFTQVDGDRHRSRGGLGIGLTLVRQLAEMHGGRVEAHSEGRGKGSEFVVRLPAPPGPARQDCDGVS